MEQQLKYKRTLDSNCIHIASQYFESFFDFFNLEFVCKKFRGNLEQFKFNPISVSDETIKYFPNMESLHVYTMKDPYIHTKTFEKYIYWRRVTYSQSLEFQMNPSIIFKKIFFTKEDREIYYTNVNGIPLQIKDLDYQCFSNCGLVSLEIPSQVTYIGQQCFDRCQSLQSLKIGKKWTLHGNRLFNNETRLCSVQLPENIKQINGEMIKITPLTSYEIADNVIVLDKYCFDNCKSLSSITIPSSLKYISSKYLMSLSSLKVVNVKGDWTYRGDRIFNNSHRFNSIHLPSTVTKINSQFIDNKRSFDTFEIPTYVTSIEEYCFANCNDLKSVVIPSTVQTIGKGCFSNTPHLKERSRNEKIRESDLAQIAMIPEMFNQLIELTGKQMGFVLFDSNYDSWGYDSVFNKKILGKSNLLFIIKREFDLYIGGYINAVIDKEDAFITDPNAFLFTCKEGIPRKYNIIQEKQQEAFKLYSSKFGNLFQMGENDLFIYKQYYTSLVFSYDNSSFDYENQSFALIRSDQTIHFVPEQLIVVQLV